MKAVLLTRYGPPEALEFQDIEKPVPAQDQVLVKILAASLNISDYYTMTGGPARLFQGFSKPKDPKIGSDIAGRVEAVGSAITRFKPGDEVFGTVHGGFAEYGVTREIRLAPKPANWTFEAAATVAVAGTTALQGLRDSGHIQAGQKVLVYGASGGVGPFAVQIARAFGGEVTAVCSPRTVEQNHSIGAAHVIDYTQEDFTRRAERYDLILAVNGYHWILDYLRVLSPTGRYVLVGASGNRVLFALVQAATLGRLVSRKGGRQLGFMGLAKLNQEDLMVLKEMMEAGKIVPVIDRRYPFSEIREAFRYMGERHPRSKIVVTIDQADAI